MVLAYEGVNAERLPGTSVEAHRQRLFNIYIDRMLQRRGRAARYSTAQTLRWLSWLAQQMVHSSQTIFLIEWLDHNWLQTSRQRWLYIILSSLLMGLAFGIIIAFSAGAERSWLSVGLKVWGVYSMVQAMATWASVTVERMTPSSQQVFLQRLSNSLGIGLLTGLIFGMVTGALSKPETGWLVGLLSGLVTGVMDWWVGSVIGTSFLKPVEALRWSWTNARRYLFFGLVGSVQFTLLLSLLGAVTVNWTRAALFGILVGLAFGLLTGLRAGAEVETRIIPNQGIWSSAKISVIVATVATLVCTLMIRLLNQWLAVPIGWAVFYGLFVGLLMGGTACVIHFSLRVIFYAYNKMPWNYARFLNYGVCQFFCVKG
jgi:eukaryotic-like serine/threonine-protein kinase